jgi:uracil-DNA glycosylase
MNNETPSLGRALQLMEQHLQHLKEEGVMEVEVSADFNKPPARPAAPPPPPQVARSATPAAAAAPAVPRAPVTGWKKSAAPQTVLLPRAPQPDDADPELVAIAKEIAGCEKCGLCKTRSRTVPGQGNPRPEIMFVGEGPGTDEDKQGLAFIGRAGQLLTRMITAMGFTREQVFIGNIVKCRPTVDGAGFKDRPPTPEEMAACIPYLHRQIAVLKPKVIVALGATAVKGLFNDPGIAISRVRGKWMSFDGIDVMPTYHPSYLLRQGGDSGTGDKEAYWQVWGDLTEALKKIGREPPKKK